MKPSTGDLLPAVPQNVAQSNRPCRLPWQALRSPSEVWLDLPTFVVGEYMFIAGAAIALAHAAALGRLHLLVWVPRRAGPRGPCVARGSRAT